MRLVIGSSAKLWIHCKPIGYESCRQTAVMNRTINQQHGRWCWRCCFCCLHLIALWQTASLFFMAQNTNKLTWFFYINFIASTFRSFCQNVKGMDYLFYCNGSRFFCFVSVLHTHTCYTFCISCICFHVWVNEWMYL